jgi:Ion channel
VFRFSTTLKMFAVGAVMTTLLFICFIGLTSIFQSQRGLYVFLVGDLAIALAYIRFFLGAISGVWERRYVQATATAVTYGILISFIGMLVTFAATYYVLGTQWHGQLVTGDNSPGISNRVDAFYFATTIFTTVGFGDIHAQGELARAIVSGQMLFTYVYAVTALALIATASFGGVPRNRDL